MQKSNSGEGILHFQSSQLHKDFVRYVLKHGDDSFTSADDFIRKWLPPLENGFKYSIEDMPVMLKMRQNVLPHPDDDMGEFAVGSAFTLVAGEVMIQVGDDFSAMKPGDTVIFDHKIYHSVYNKSPTFKTWAGVTINVI